MTDWKKQENNNPEMDRNAEPKNIPYKSMEISRPSGEKHS